MSDWQKVTLSAPLEDGEMRALTVGSRRLILYRSGCAYFLTERRCTHQGADLLRGYFANCIIECPVHQGRFDVRTGQALNAPASDALGTHEVRVEGLEVWVRIRAG